MVVFELKPRPAPYRFRVFFATSSMTAWAAAGSWSIDPCLLRESDRLRLGSLFKVEHLGRVSWRLVLANTTLCGSDFEFSPEE